MLQFEELMLTLKNVKPDIDDLREALGYDKLSAEVADLEQKAAAPGFWDDMENSQKILKRTASLKGKIAAFDAITSTYDDTMTLIELGNEEEELELLEEAQTEVDAIKKSVEELRLTTLLTGEYDSNNAILTFHAGAGGTEAQDWAEMLFRMYNRWGERHGFKVKTIDYLDGDEAGLKSASILIEGTNAYGYLKCEMGVHRLVRISPFDSSGRRHTSFASLEVMPEIDDDVDVEIRPEDLHIDTYRSSGAGGQHINKTESAVRITHLPTGLVVECQDERSQYKNKDKAMKILRSRLYDKLCEEQNEKIASDRRSQVGTGSRSERIRTYNFPESRFTDHRIGLTIYRLEAILNGALDEVIDALTTADQAAKLAGEE